MNKDIVLVTGAAGGIGLTCVHGLKDYNLVITDYNSDVVAKTVEQLKTDGYSVTGIACDITDKTSIDKLVKFTGEQGNLKGIIHAAGVSGTVGNPKLVFDINLLASYNLVQAFKPHLGEGSSVVLLSSMMGHTVPPNPVYDEALRNPHNADAYEVIEKFIENNADNMYNFSKRGVLLMTKDFAMELGRLGARISAISPGVIMTPMSKKALEEHPEVMQQTLDMTPLHRYGQPEDIAQVARFLISDEASFISGTDIIVDGGVLTQMLP